MESHDLSSDIMFEILTLTSLQTLGKCRLVCKEWNHITYQSSFMPLHCYRTGTISGCFVQSMNRNKHLSTFVRLDNLSSVSSLSLDFLPVPVKIEASSNQGLLYCVSQEPQSLRNPRIPRCYVCKPSTKQWQLIPNPKTRYFTERAAMMVLRLNPLHYKIVRFSEPKFRSKEYYNLRCEIFDSKIWAWKQSKEVQLPHCVLLRNNPAILASGKIHWLTTHDHLFSFRPDEESWSMIPLPENGYHSEKQLVEYEGRLALLCMERERGMELWVIEDYRNGVWNECRGLNMEVLRFASPAALYKVDIELMNVVRQDKHGDPCNIFAFRSDLEPTNLMGVEAKFRI